MAKNNKGNRSTKMKTLFVLGFPNPFSGTSWARIGFLAGLWSKKGHIVEILVLSEADKRE